MRADLTDDVLIIANPGTGKTTALATRVAELLFDKTDAKPTAGLQLRSGELHETNNEIVVRNYVDGKEVFRNHLQLPQIIRVGPTNGTQRSPE
jgi:hypothetical protein